MAWPDIAIVAVVALSALVGLFRGFVEEVVALATWVAAFWLALRFSGEVAAWLPQGLDEVSFTLAETGFEVTNLRVGVAFVLLAVGTLILGGAVTYALGKLTQGAVVKGVDRFLGLGFGILRGMAIVVVLVMAGGLTNAPRTAWWQASALLAPFERAAMQVAQAIPREYSQYFSFER